MALKFELPRGEPKARLDKVLLRFFPDRSRATLQRWVVEGRVLVGGRPSRPSELIGPGIELLVEPGGPPPSDAEPDPTVVLNVLFEDDSLLVIDKPAGLVVHPARGHRTKTMVHGLLARESFKALPLLAEPEGLLRPGIVHRLDKDTSGILVVAKTTKARESLKDQLSTHSMERVYRAITLGVPRAGLIDTWYGRHPKSRLRFSSMVRGGKRAVTGVTVAKVLAEGRAALVECRLKTGRTHQIRVHLAEQAKAPVLGDALYGRRPSDPLLREVSDNIGRQALHAATLGFEHPLSGERLSFSSPLPEDMAAAFSRLEEL